MVEWLENALPQIVTGVFGLAAAVIGYLFGRRSKVDDIRIKKTHEFAEELSVLMQEDFRDRKFAREQYERSFGHLNDLQRVIQYFEEYDSLYGPLREVMHRLEDNRPRIVEVRQRSSIYLPEKIGTLVDEYIELTMFTYMTDGIGLIDNYAASFFQHCLDEKKSSRREEIFKDVMRRLRKVR